MEEEKKENKEEKQEGTKEEKTGKKQNKMVIALVVVAAILVGLYFVGRSLSRKIGEGIAGGFLSGLSGKNVKVDGGGEKVTVTGEDGEISFETGGDLPEGFPKDFPIYTGSKLVNSFSASGEDGDGISVIWETGDSFEKVADFYKKKLSEDGWTVESTFEQKDSFTSSFKKGEIGGFIGVTPGEGNKVTISVTIGVK